MKYGLVIQDSDVKALCDIAAEAEEFGWDAVFIADALSIETKGYPASPWYDPWIAMAAIAMRTERIRIATMIAAISRRRPWKLAREAQTLDYTFQRSPDARRRTWSSRTRRRVLQSRRSYGPQNSRTVNG